MNTQAAALEEQNEQINVIADIFANMLCDAETVLANQRAAMEAQIASSTLSIGLMIKDAMLSICASAGIDNQALKTVVERKKNLLDQYGHTDFKRPEDTEGGSQD